MHILYTQMFPSIFRKFSQNFRHLLHVHRLESEAKIMSTKWQITFQRSSSLLLLLMGVQRKTTRPGISMCEQQLTKEESNSAFSAGLDSSSYSHFQGLWLMG